MYLLLALLLFLQLPHTLFGMAHVTSPKTPTKEVDTSFFLFDEETSNQDYSADCEEVRLEQSPSLRRTPSFILCLDLEQLEDQEYPGQDSLETHDSLSRGKTEGVRGALPRCKRRQSVQEVEEVLSPKSMGLELIKFCKVGNLFNKVGMSIIEDCLQRNADLEVCDYSGSALMWLSHYGFEEGVAALLERGATISTVSKRGFTAIHAAAEAGHFAILRILIEHNPAENLIDYKKSYCGSTALHLAAQNGHNLVVSYLLSQGALVDPVDIFGRTPLHLACWKRHDMAASLLLKAGANKNAHANRGITPLAAAKHGGNDIIVLELIGRGARENVDEVEEL